jgi:hypothetical protein
MTVSTTPGGSYQGISFAASSESSAYNQLNLSSLHLPLTDTIVPARGASTPSFARATAAWEFDNEGKLNLNIPQGCIRFGGARFVRNMWATKSEDFDNAAWTKTALTCSGNVITTANATSAQYISQQVSANTGSTYLQQWRVEYTNHAFVQIFFGSAIGSGHANFDILTGQCAALDGAACGMTLVSPGVYDIWARSIPSATTSAGSANGLAIVNSISSTKIQSVTGDGVKSVKLVRTQYENVSGQADQTASEYVSVGVLSSPYHGAGTLSTADGCKWFPTNKDGSAIPAATLRRYFAEPARNNNCLWGRDLTNAVWTAVDVTPTKTATGLDSVANSASRVTVGADNGTIKQLLTAATGSRTLSVYVKRISGTGTLELTRNDGTNWTDRTSQLVANTWVRVSLTADTGANSTIGYRFGTAGDVFEFDISQDENGAWPTSPIITTTAAVTRNPDTLSYTSAGFINDTAGTVIASVAVASAQTTTTYAVSTNNTFVMLYKGNFGANLSSQDGTSQINTGTWSNDGLVKKIGLTWSGSARGVCFNGGTVTAGAYDGSWNATSIQVGTLGANYLGGYIGDIHVWTTALTDTQLQQVLS